MSPLPRASAAAAAAALVVRPAAAGHQHGGGECGTEWDCSLGGRCVDGSCRCDVWFTGPSCALLNLARAKLPNGLDLGSTGTWTWGGHAVPAAAGSGSGWVGHFSLITGGCTLGAYRTNSESAFGTAAEVDGPYLLRDMQNPDAAANAAVAPASHCTQIKQHPSGEYHLWHILPGNNAEPKSCKGPGGGGAAEAEGFSQNLYVHTAPTPEGPWAGPHAIVVAPLKPNTTASQSWCSAPYYYPNGSALLVFGGQACPPGWGGRGGCIWVSTAPTWRGPYSEWRAAPATHPENEDPAIFEDPRGNLHMVTNVNTGHARCHAGAPCGGHAWSRDGLTWSDTFVGSFGPDTLLLNGTVAKLGFVERPQIAQLRPGTPPLALFLATGYTHRSYTWAQPFCNDTLLAAGSCGFMGGLPPPQPPPSPPAATFV